MDADDINNGGNSSQNIPWVLIYWPNWLISGLDGERVEILTRLSLWWTG